MKGLEKDFQPGKIIIFSVTHFVHDIYTAFISPLLPIVIKRLGLTFLKAGILLPAFRIPVLIQPFIGYHADRGRALKFLPLALVITSISMSLFASVNSYYMAFVILFITGISAAFYHAPAVFLIGNFSGPRTGTGMAVFMTGGELARAMGPLYIVTILNFIPLKYSLIASLPGLIFSVILFLSVPEVSKKSYVKGQDKRIVFSDLFRYGGKGLYYLIFISIFQSFTKFSFTLFLPTFMKELGFKLFIAGSSLTALEFTGAIGALTGGTVSDFLGKKRFLILSTVAVPTFINLFLISDSLSIKILFLMLEGIFMFSISPVRYALGQELIPEFKGTVSSLLMALSFFTTTFASIVTGYLGDILGLYNAFKIISFIPLITIPVIILLPENKKS